MVSTIATWHIGHSVTDLSNLRGTGVQHKTRWAPLTIPIHWLPPQVGGWSWTWMTLLKVPQVERELGASFEITGGLLLVLIVLIWFWYDILCKEFGSYLWYRVCTSTWLASVGFGLSCTFSYYSMFAVFFLSAHWRVATRWHNCMLLLSRMCL